MTEQLLDLQRIIGEYSKGEEGPTVIFMAGVHGNERASIIALNSVFSQLNQLSPHFKGKLVGIAGNLAALSKSIRYVEEDLNRIWSVPRIQNLLAPIQPFQNGETVEKFEQKDLVRTLQSYCQNKDAPVYVIDLHTTSATSPPFVIILDTLRNRHFALKFPLPIVLGMEEHLDGTLINYLDQFGFITMAIEAGQHEQQSSIQNHIAAIWLALIHAGCIALEEIPQFTYYQTKLRSETEHLPRVFEVVYRYPITNGERFRMESGFVNFQKVRKGQILARNQEGKIQSPRSGNIFMPLYQAKGQEGFFIIREFRFFWLKISEWVRKIRLEKLLPILPGIQKRSNANEFIINPQIARWYVIEIFHLLGYRRKRILDNKIVMQKRKHDLDSLLSV